MDQGTVHAPANLAQQPLCKRIAHWERVIRQYEREIDILSGTVHPETDEFDEVVFLARLAPVHRRQAFLVDRRLRLQILRAGTELMREMLADAGDGRASAAAMSGSDPVQGPAAGPAGRSPRSPARAAARWTPG